jgi:nucleoside-diphosphate kinase
MSTEKQRTLCILKPDAVERHLVDKINHMIENAGLRIVAKRELQLTLDQAKDFYAIHKDRGFFNDLCSYMSRSPVVVQVLEGPDAVIVYRNLMGATDPKNAEPNTIRKEYGESIDYNTVHGSDAAETAAEEISFFFGSREIGEWK